MGEGKTQEEHGSLHELRRQSWELWLTKATRVCREECFTERVPDICRRTLKSLAKDDQSICMKMMRPELKPSRGTGRKTSSSHTGPRIIHVLTSQSRKTM